jgi:hypothetical protein
MDPIALGYGPKSRARLGLAERNRGRIGPVKATLQTPIDIALDSWFGHVSGSGRLDARPELG